MNALEAFHRVTFNSDLYLAAVTVLTVLFIALMLERRRHVVLGGGGPDDRRAASVSDLSGRSRQIAHAWLP